MGNPSSTIITGNLVAIRSEAVAWVVLGVIRARPERKPRKENLWLALHRPLDPKNQHLQTFFWSCCWWLHTLVQWTARFNIFAIFPLDGVCLGVDSCRRIWMLFWKELKPLVNKCPQYLIFYIVKAVLRFTCWNLLSKCIRFVFTTVACLWKIYACVYAHPFVRRIHNYGQQVSQLQ